jgi:hypothetical protein
LTCSSPFFFFSGSSDFLGDVGDLATGDLATGDFATGDLATGDFAGDVGCFTGDAGALTGEAGLAALVGDLQLV